MDTPAQTHSLSQIQNWLQTAIAHPKGVYEGIQSAEARQLMDVNPADLEKVLTRSLALTAVERLSIYANAYYARLVECLSEEFPTLKHALGEEVFGGFAVSYLQKYPSRTYTLLKLGSDFPQFLQETRPARDEGDSSADWADFLIDLASLELVFNEVFDGPGTEGQRLLDAQQLGAMPAERLPKARLVPVNCLRLLEMRFPVHEYMTAVRKKQDAVLPSAAATFLAVSRRNFVVQHYELSHPAYLLLSALIAGEQIGKAIMGVVATAPDTDLDLLEANLRSWFYDWAAEGLFRAVEISPEPGP